MYITIKNVTIATVRAKSESDNEVCHIKTFFVFSNSYNLNMLKI